MVEVFIKPEAIAPVTPPRKTNPKANPGSMDVFDFATNVHSFPSFFSSKMPFLKVETVVQSASHNYNRLFFNRFRLY